MTSSEYVSLCACPVTSLWNNVYISSEAAVSDCTVLNFRTWCAFAKEIHMCLFSVTRITQCDMSQTVLKYVLTLFSSMSTTIGFHTA